jgi:hypothetical protein
MQTSVQFKNEIVALAPEPTIDQSAALIDHRLDS